MKLTEDQAKNKVENEARQGWRMIAKPAGPEPLPVFIDESEDD